MCQSLSNYGAVWKGRAGIKEVFYENWYDIYLWQKNSSNKCLLSHHYSRRPVSLQFWLWVNCRKDIGVFNPNQALKCSEQYLNLLFFRHPLEGSVGFSPQRLFDSEASNQSNQTDDEKITDNIVNFAGNLVGESMEHL